LNKSDTNAGKNKSKKRRTTQKRPGGWGGDIREFSGPEENARQKEDAGKGEGHPTGSQTTGKHRLGDRGNTPLVKKNSRHTEGEKVGAR